MESTYWRADGGFYAFATALPRAAAPIAESGPNRATRQARLDALRSARLIDEDTVLPAVPLWFGAAQDDRAQLEIDHLGSAAIATDWGTRLLSNRSALYDPLSYHYGSVWPLFTGWTAMGAYRYGRPHVGYQALMANALLTYAGALGDVTELLSGDFATPFGRSSHHQIWSEAMVVAPVIRGLLGIEISEAGGTLRIAPMLPAHWDRVAVRGVSVRGARYDLTLERTRGRLIVRVARPASDRASAAPTHLMIAPALPLDARVQRVTVNGTLVKHDATIAGDVQRVQIATDDRAPSTEVVFSYGDGTDVYVEPQRLRQGQPNDGLRILRVRAGADALRLTLEGRGSRSYSVGVRTPRRLGTADGVSVTAPPGADPQLQIRFDGPAEQYVRREIVVPLLAR
jgi:mannosylglycerate hydrolase MGH1-like protein/glycosyl hydrolase family 65